MVMLVCDSAEMYTGGAEEKCRDLVDASLRSAKWKVESGQELVWALWEAK